MKIVINNRTFNYDIGCRLLKLKYKEPFEGLEDIWKDIVPLSFNEILAMDNIEDRRVGIDCFGLERLHKELDADLVDTQTIKKKTTWVLENGDIYSFEYDDVYQLYKIQDSKLNNNKDRWKTFSDQYYVLFKDTSTDRQYLLWINKDSVFRTNNPTKFSSEPSIDAIEAIAWTITTDIPEGNIEEIIRQGDCILIKPKGSYKNLPSPRHLTKKEYLELLTNES